MEPDKYEDFIGNPKHVKNLAIEFLDQPFDKFNPIGFIFVIHNEVYSCSNFFDAFGKSLKRHVVFNSEMRVKITSKYYNGTLQIEDDAALHGFVWMHQQSYRTKSFEMFLTKRNVRGFTNFMLGTNILRKWIRNNGNAQQHHYAYMFHDFTWKYLCDPQTGAQDEKFCGNQSFHDLMFVFFTTMWGRQEMTTRKRRQIMHKWLSAYKPYCDYIDNFPPLKIKVCVIYEQNNENDECIVDVKKADILFADEYVVMHICNMLDISCD